jgi:amphi-Trp domain-containing protein
VASIPSRFRGRARRDAAAFYLSELARGILAGEFGVLVGNETVPVQPTDFLLLEIAVTRKSRANHVSVRIQWPRRSLDRAAAGQPGKPGPADRSPSRSHLEFTPLSSGRNLAARDSYPDAKHE